MKKIFFINHKDSGNRGCEAITNSMIKLLGSKFKYYIFSDDPNADSSVGINKYATIINFNNISILKKIILKVFRFLKFNSDFIYIFKHKSFLNLVKKDDIVLSTGGDLYCYEENEVPLLVDYFYKKNIKVYLIGATICPTRTSERKFNSLKKFSKITLRDKNSFMFLKELGFTNIFYFPDSAFYFDPSHSDFIDINLQRSIGINISPHIISTQEQVSKYIQFLNYILKVTSNDIYLIPHVFWTFDSDIKVINKILVFFENNPRVKFLNTQTLSYLQIRELISNLSLFIGARTHSIISSYCVSTPAILLSYSEKSVNIHLDIGLPKEFVIFKDDSVQLMNNKFLYVLNNRSQIKAILNKAIKKYKDSFLDNFYSNLGLDLIP